jgi:hypothetical protein
VTGCGEYDEAGVLRPPEESAEIVTVGIQGAAAVAGQEGNGSELRVVDDEVVRWQCDCPRRGLDGDHGWSSCQGETANPARSAGGWGRSLKVAVW